MGAVKNHLIIMVYVIIEELKLNNDYFEDIQDWIIDNQLLNTPNDELIKHAKQHFIIS